ncbi:hypothetical protein ALC56_02943 [Trachymyrmex septentrionalis]|uniref:Uncharacterized protein n=1 Tax=Trachymyrmex septentrionalis TaxID=34720 RepID=A0A195FQ53_9HYME|nr:hypothetical protein ALC56_02943 [Trachymyrmex septentrionalis]
MNCPDAFTALAKRQAFQRERDERKRKRKRRTEEQPRRE